MDFIIWKWLKMMIDDDDYDMNDEMMKENLGRKRTRRPWRGSLYWVQWELSGNNLPIDDEATFMGNTWKLYSNSSFK